MSEGYAGFTKARLEAFSDGVIAVIITIMVLELKAPDSATPEALLRLWPNFTIYLVSFIFVGVYWINHHALFNAAMRITPALVWANIGLLFFLSLFPFATAYVGNAGLKPLPTAVYAALQFACGAIFAVITSVIASQRRDESTSTTETSALKRKNAISLVGYAASVVVAFFSPLTALAIFVLIGIAYVRPTAKRGEQQRTPNA